MTLVLIPVEDIKNILRTKRIKTLNKAPFLRSSQVVCSLVGVGPGLVWIDATGT